MNPAMQGARANAAASEAIKDSANNRAGAMTGFMGMGMINQGGAMFGANMSAQSQSNQGMSSMNTPVQVSTVSSQPETINNQTASSNKCPNCGALASGKFCQECGTKIETKKFCPNCGNEVQESSKFCIECGTKLY